MTTIVVVVATTPAPLPTGVTFANVSVAITDNSGAVLTPVTVNGTESPAWTVTVTGTAGPNEAMAVLTAMDTTGKAIGTPVTITETGTGGVTTFPAPSGGTITVS